MKPTVFNYQEYERLKEQLDSIVHCKDCERYVPQHRRCEWTWIDRDPKDFCSRGERREP